MSKLLIVDVSPRGDYSISRQLAKHFEQEWTKSHEGGTIVVRDLAKNMLPMVDLPWVMGAYSTPDQHTPEQAAAMKLSDELIDELLSVDEILIATPLFNFSLPAALKAWIDQISRLDRTFNAKYEGLVKGKKVSIILASGGVYAPGSYMAGMDFFTGYMKGVLGFLGMTDVKQYFAGDTTAVAKQTMTMEAYIAEHAPKMIDTLLK